MLLVVAAVVLRDQRLLVMSKHVAPAVFYLPGGKPDAGESESQTLRRELTEEIGAQPVDATPYLVVEALAALEEVPMRLVIYRCSLSAPPSRSGEIAMLGWTNGADEYAAGLAPAIGDVVVPRLRQDGLLSA
jgi:8-oxo-dGTP diphosphatase